MNWFGDHTIIILGRKEVESFSQENFAYNVSSALFSPSSSSSPSPSPSPRSSFLSKNNHSIYRSSSSNYSQPSQSANLSNQANTNPSTSTSSTTSCTTSYYLQIISRAPTRDSLRIGKPKHAVHRILKLPFPPSIKRSQSLNILNTVHHSQSGIDNDRSYLSSSSTQESLPHSKESLPQYKSSQENGNVVDSHHASSPCFFELSFIRKKKSKNQKIYGNENEKYKKKIDDEKNGKEIEMKKNLDEVESYDESCIVVVGNGYWCVGYMITALLSLKSAESADVDVIDYEVRLMWNVNLSLYTNVTIRGSNDEKNSKKNDNYSSRDNNKNDNNNDSKKNKKIIDNKNNVQFNNGPKGMFSLPIRSMTIVPTTAMDKEKRTEHTQPKSDINKNTNTNRKRCRDVDWKLHTDGVTPSLLLLDRYGAAWHFKCDGGGMEESDSKNKTDGLERKCENENENGNCNGNRNKYENENKNENRNPRY